MADRFHGLLAVGHRITSAFSRERIFAEVLNGVRTLLRGEASVVVEVTQENGMLRCRPVAGDMNGDISNALAMLPMIRAAFWQPDPVYEAPLMEAAAK